MEKFCKYSPVDCKPAARNMDGLTLGLPVMERIYTSSSLVLVGQLEQLLAQNRIACFIKNEHLAGGIGELPVFDCWPELWVADSQQAGRARALVAAYLNVTTAPGANEWRCPACAEMVEPEFGTCWKCGQDRET